ncbi:MAG TPA: trigger factor [Acidimicrobiales bacterium]|nr:trigger factor [Acidimicrobiales bacterium]
MKTTVAPLEGNKVKLSVEVDEDEFDKAITDAFRKISREVRIPGFRPGKAPRKVLERRLGPQVGREQALHDALPEYYAQAISDHDVDAIDAPHIDITSGEEDGPVAFEATVEVRPVVQVPGYGGLRVEIARPEVPEDEIDAQIDRMRQVQATFADVDRPARDDDAVIVDITGTLDGEAQDGLTADDYSYTVGSDAVTQEVDEQLRGAKAGDILEFDATHPDPDEERQLRFKVLVKQVRERVLPEADDEWAAENSEFDTIDALRASIRERSSLVRRAQAQGALREATGQALAKLVDDEMPESLVSHEMNHRAQELAMRLQAQGLTPEQWMAVTGKSSEDLTAELREAAETSAKVDLALRAVADAEQIECTDDDLDEELEEVATRVGEPVGRVRAEFERGGQLSAVRSDVRKRKALDWLLERVEIVDEDGRAIDRADLEISPQTDEHGSDEDDVPGNETGAAGSETSDESTDESDETDETDGKEMETDPR